MENKTRASRKEATQTDELESTRQNRRSWYEQTAAHRVLSRTPEPPAFIPPPASQHRSGRMRYRRRRTLRRIVRLAFGLIATSVISLAFLATLYALFPPPRMNILVLGVDARHGEGYVTRSDTVMLVTVDPGQPYIGILSIPRDLSLDVPGRGYTRINAAHTYGESATQGGGSKLVAQTLANNFNLPVHRTVRMNFEGFTAIIDAAGGVNIDVPAPLHDEAYPTADYGVTTIHFDAGPQHMDGERALQYARTRHSSNDFRRAERQQQVILALRRKLSNPLNWWRLPLVYGAFVSYVETDVTPIDAALLAPAVLRVGPGNVERVVLSRENSMVVNAGVEGDPFLLAPNWSQVNPLVDRMFRR